MGTRLAFGVEPSNRSHRLRLARYPALAETLAAFVRAADRPLRLLDVGVGRGRTRRYLATDVAQRVAFHGIDLHPGLALRCHEASAWRLVRADATQPLPFRDRTFDVAVCEQVMEHLVDPGATLAEIARCLRPAGLLVLGVPTFPPGVAVIRDRLARPEEHGHVQSFTKRSAVDLVTRSGAFDVRGVRGFRSFSGGIASPLEDFRWWWRANAAFGRAFPSLCAEVQIAAVRRRE